MARKQEIKFENRGILIAYANASMRTNRAAKEVFMSPSGFQYRLDKIKEETGLDPRAFWDLVQLLGLGKERKANEQTAL